MMTTVLQIMAAGKEYNSELKEGLRLLHSRGVIITFKEFLSFLAILGVIKRGEKTE